MLTKAYKQLLLSIAANKGLTDWNAEYETKVKKSTLKNLDVEFYIYLSRLAKSLGVDFDATKYTFRVSRSKYVNQPSFWAVDGVLSLVWGEVIRPLEDMVKENGVAYRLVTDTYDKDDEIFYSHYLVLDIAAEFYDEVGDTSITFPLVAEGNVTKLEMAKAIRSKDIASHVKSYGRGGFPQSLWKLLQGKEKGEGVDIWIANARMSEGKFRNYVVKVEVNGSPAQGEYQISLTSKLSRYFDGLEDLAGMAFTMTHDGDNEFNGKSFIQTEFSNVTLARYRDYLGEDDSVEEEYQPVYAGAGGDSYVELNVEREELPF